MTSPVGTVRTYFDGGEVGYGYGLDVEEYLGDTLVGHRGDIGVSSAWFGYLEDAKLGVVLACQTSPEAHPLVVGPAVLALLEGENPNEVVPHYRLVKAFETVSGEYEGYRAIVTATVEVDGGTLTFESENDFGGGQTLRLVPTRVEEDSLVCSTVSNWGRKEEVRFEFGGGEVDLFVADRRLRKSSHVGQS